MQSTEKGVSPTAGRKLLPKHANLFTKRTLQTNSAKRLQKLRPKNGPVGSPTAVPGRCFPKVFCRAAPESCASKLPPEVAVRSYCRKAATFQTCKPKIAPIVANDVCFLMFFAQQAPKILSLTVFLKDFSDSLPNKAVKLVRKTAPLIWATTQSCCLMFYPQTLPKSC